MSPGTKRRASIRFLWASCSETQVNSDASRLICAPIRGDAGGAVWGGGAGGAGWAGGVGAASGRELADKPLVASTGCTGVCAKGLFQAHTPKMTTTIPTSAEPDTMRHSRLGCVASSKGWVSAVNSIVRTGSAGEVAVNQEETAVFVEAGSGRDTVSVAGSWTGSGCAEGGVAAASAAGAVCGVGSEEPAREQPVL